MKLVVLSVVIYLSQAAVVPQKELLENLKNQFIPLEAQILTGAELVDYLNENQQLFQAELAPQSHALERKLMKSHFINQNHKPVVMGVAGSDDDIPESFDSRTQWPECPSLKYIRDQANCGSCWAVSSAEAMSDRVCIASKGETTVELSANDLVSCCSECGYGCEGGWPIKAWEYFKNSGLPTGGDYGTKDACEPYQIHPCGRHPNQTYYGECFVDADTPKCTKTCQKGYKIPYNKDKRFGKSAYELPHSVKAIQKDIMKNGPVVAGFAVYSDFMHYKKGIYKHTAGRQEGGHAVKIVGWGTEAGVPYWTIANSWNTDWGENGYFRMIRGINNCEIEENVVAGLV